ncbi:adenine deaminase [Gluconacetobacter sacchari]|uniref:Adenine deaminase n=2 Tax=Gluconacetobacter sacchari TaxID=92759 RepID=A0A7W4IEE6_9PROT|nr:adenine deaminase [Gluconacetobacter sacchari]MBB2161335.1 adenine deaminase [Gluconacetobacter sacchari]
MAHIPPDLIARRIRQGTGAEPADLVIRDVRLFDLVTGALIETDIALCGDTIVGTLDRYDGSEAIDGRGRIVVPGFIDTHLHVESSLVTPFEFERCVLPHGVTTAICDPHEMANVLGVPALRYFLDAASRMVMDLRVNLSSCVPSSPVETSGAVLMADDLAPLMNHPKVIGLAEFMNMPGVLSGDPGCMDKLAAFAGRHIDGHAPLMRGKALNGYLSGGISTDHEATRADEALEKIRKGMTVLIREGSVCKDLAALAPLLTVETSPFLAFCTDDRNPLEIAHEGHIDFLIRSAIARGVPPLAAYRAASLTAARAFGLTDRGMLAPGKRADIVFLDDLEGCAVSDVLAGGRPIGPALAARKPIPAPGRDSVILNRPVTATDFAIPGSGARRPVMGIVPGQIITTFLTEDLAEADGRVLADADRDLAKVAVVARHGLNGNIGRGFVRGFGLRGGALASSVGHDAHNICVVGTDDSDMAVAVNRLAEIGGGFVVVAQGTVRAELRLPIAGLMSDAPFETVRAQLEILRAATRDMGVTLEEPFLQLAFLPLPVVPHLKITDHGLVDVGRMAVIG